LNNFLDDEIEPFVTSVDVQAVGNNIEQQNSQLINQLPLENPKIWMNFDDFCACFTSVKNIVVCFIIFI